jgi:hypothetical protein
VKRSQSMFRTLTLIGFTLILTAIANAQASRTWVSGVGDDVNPCSRTAPCKTFAGAISKTARDGEIDALDPAGFGVVTITKSITIAGPKGYGNVGANLVTGITINITDPADVNKAVRLRSLVINGGGTGIRGVNIIAANDVHIEDTLIDAFVNEGVQLNTTASCTLHLADSIIRRTATGIKVTTTSGFAVATIKNAQIVDNTTGLDVADNGYATISDSVVSNNVDGIKTSSSGAIIAAIRNVLAHNSGAAICASVAGSTIRALSNHMVANTTGINAVGTVTTAGQNRNDGNTTPGAPNGGVITVH